MKVITDTTIADLCNVSRKAVSRVRQGGGSAYSRKEVDRAYLKAILLLAKQRAELRRQYKNND